MPKSQNVLRLNQGSMLSVIFTINLDENYKGRINLMTRSWIALSAFFIFEVGFIGYKDGILCCFTTSLFLPLAISL